MFNFTERTIAEKVILIGAGVGIVGNTVINVINLTKQKKQNENIKTIGIDLGGVKDQVNNIISDVDKLSTSQSIVDEQIIQLKDQIAAKNTEFDKKMTDMVQYINALSVENQKNFNEVADTNKVDKKDEVKETVVEKKTPEKTPVTNNVAKKK